MPIEIPFNAPDAKEAVAVLTKLNTKLKTTEDRLKAVSEAYSKMSGDLGDIADLAGAIGGVGKKGGGGGKKGGGSDSVDDSQEPPKKTKRSEFEQWARTMRFGAGKLSPLVGRTADMAGKALGLAPEAVATLAVGLGVAAMALEGFTVSVSTAASASQTYRDAFFSGGPGVGGALRAGSMYEGGIGGRAAALQQAIQSGGAASAYAQAAGINIVGAPFGDIDYNKKYQMALKDLAQRTPEEARRIAISYGQPDMANIALLSPGNQRVALDNSVRDQNMGQMADMNFSLNETKRLSEELYRDILVPALKDAVEAGREFLDTIVWIKDMMKSLHTEELANSVKRMYNPFGTGFSEIKQKYQEMKAQQGHQSAVEDNTKATDELTRAMNENTNERHGGGSRTKDAYPQGIPGWYIDDAEVRRGIKTGMY